jgi:hypothetical protein
MLSPIVTILLGLLTLLFGRRIFWLFVGVAGFLFGLSVAQVALPGQAEATQLLAGFCVGLIFAGLALAIQRPMAMLAGFLALGLVGQSLGSQLGLPIWAQIALFIVFGLLGLLLVAALFDWALIIASSLNGAAAVSAGLAALLSLPAWAALVILLALAILGIAYQARDMGARARPARGV